MKLPKKNSDFTKTMSEVFFNTLNLVTNDNIKNLYDDPSSHFFVIILEKKKMVVIRDFYRSPRRVKGYINFKSYYDNKVLVSKVKINEEQSLEDYKDESDYTKKMIKEEIDKKRLYVKTG